MKRERETSRKTALEAVSRCAPILPHPIWWTKLISVPRRYAICVVVLLISSTPLAAITGETSAERLEKQSLAPPQSYGPIISGGPGAAKSENQHKSALAQAVAGGGEMQSSGDTAPSVKDRVRRAGELLAEGDDTRAGELVLEAIRDCDGGQGDVRDCSRWMSSLRGLRSVIGKGRERIELKNSIGMRMVRIPPGEYMMGSLSQEMDWLRLTFKTIWRDGHKQWFQDELPLHPVRITKPFYMSATEVTVGQFREFVAATGYKTDAEKEEGGMIWSTEESRWVPRKEMRWNSLPWKISDDQPVVFVSWNDAKAFCSWLSRKEGRTYRLPSEAQWEMGCRGGLAWARYPWGNRLPGDRDMNFGDGNPKLPESLTTVNDGYEYVAPVASYPPNGLGLYDMDGNVMEWVEDYYERNYFSSSPLDDPKGPSVGTSRVNKGGNWFSSPADSRCAFRGFSGPTMSFWNLGFRVIMEEHLDDATSTTTARGGHQSPSRRSDSAGLPPAEADGLRLFRQAMFAAQQQQWENATQDLEEALKIYEKRQDHMWVARVKATLAGVYAERNRRYKSKELYTQALAEFRKIGDAASVRILLARLRELETSPGVRVVKIRKGSAAEKAGIVEGDVIIEYAGETGLRVSGLKKLVEDYAGTDKVTLSLVNNDVISTVIVPGGELGVALEDIKRPPRSRRPPPQQPRAERPRARRARR